MEMRGSGIWRDSTPPVPISVVIPSYRAAHLLPRALASVAAQTLAPLEILLVDDGNDAAEAARLAALAGGRARVIRLEQNRGVASARNAGWDAARGRYVAFLDADDAWHPRKLALQRAVMEGRPELLLTGTDLLLARDQPRWEEPAGAVPLRPYGKRLSLVINPTHPPTWMVRRETPRRFRAGRRHLEDYLFFLEAQREGEQMAHLAWPLAALFKPLLSSQGLSAELWKMELAELDTYAVLRQQRLLGPLAARGLQAISLAKFLRRAALVKVLQPLGLWAR